MTLIAATIDRTRTRPAWVAIWRTPAGNAIHDRLPLDCRTTSEADAWVYALDHYPTTAKEAA